MLRRISVIAKLLQSCWATLLMQLPNDGVFCRARVRNLRGRGLAVHSKAQVFRNVNIIGRVAIGPGSSISDNAVLSGGDEGIWIGENVMIAPGCVIVAFDHGFRDLSRPMVLQAWEQRRIVIEDDVWVGANCTITKGVRLGKGCIIGAGSVVTRDVEPRSIVGGVPARPIGRRQTESQTGSERLGSS